MRGIVIWAHSKCRSTFALYRELALLVDVRLVAREGVPAHRCAQGVREEEFEGLSCEVIGEDWAKAAIILGETRGWIHLVAAYQVSPAFRRVALEAKCRGDVVGVISEEPWNKFDDGEMSIAGTIKRLLWERYLKTVLRWRVHKVVESADFLINYSGFGVNNARVLGWAKEKIIPFGYYPERISTRGVGHAESRMRVFAPATKNRRGRGESIIRKALNGLDVSLVMPDMVSDDEVRRLYAESDVLIAAGWNEPWGVRVNDALNAGVPVIVSNGMGAIKLVQETGAGVVFRRGDVVSLRSAVAEIMEKYAKYKINAEFAGTKISPKVKAQELLAAIRRVEKGVTIQ